MPRKRPAEIEDEPPSAAKAGDNDVDHMMRLLSWARANGYAIPLATVGNTTVQVTDIRQAKIEGQTEPARDAGPRTIYEEAGMTTKDVVVDGTG